MENKENIDDDSSLYDWLNDKDEKYCWAEMFDYVMEQVIDVGSDIGCGNENAKKETN